MKNRRDGEDVVVDEVGISGLGTHLLGKQSTNQRLAFIPVVLRNSDRRLGLASSC